MTQNTSESPGTTWVCARCDGQALKPGSAKLAYMGGTYVVELLRCPRCGLVFIPEDLALGKMAEVEQILEDK
jgi:hypothetical protein